MEDWTDHTDPEDGQLNDPASPYGADERAAFIRAMQKRTRAVAVRLINLMERTPGSPAMEVIRYQVLKSGTSTAANYRAACRARSQREFYAKMSIVVEEADETVCWLQTINESCLTIDRDELKIIGNEYFELVKIFSRARKNARDRSK